MANSVRATISSVSSIIAADMSNVCPGCQLAARSRVPPSSRVFLDALAMKCRGRDPPLPPVKFALAGDQSLSQQDFHAVLGALFDERRGLRDKDFADQFGIVDEHNIAAAQLVMGHGSIAFDVGAQTAGSDSGQEKTPEQIQGQVALQPGRKAKLAFWDYPEPAGTRF